MADNWFRWGCWSPHDGISALIRRGDTRAPTLSTCTPRRGHVSIQRGGCHLQARMWALIKNHICWHLDLGLHRCQNHEKYMCVVYATQSVLFCYSSPTWWRQLVNLQCSWVWLFGIQFSSFTIWVMWAKNQRQCHSLQALLHFRHCYSWLCSSEPGSLALKEYSVSHLLFLNSFSSWTSQDVSQCPQLRWAITWAKSWKGRDQTSFFIAAFLRTTNTMCRVNC